MAGRRPALPAALLLVLLSTGAAAVSAAVPGPGMEPSPNGPKRCAAGYAKAGAGAFKCGFCSGARFQPRTGQTACISCPLPNAPNAAHTSCVPGPGQEPSSGSLPVPCKAGYAKKGAGAFACSRCSGARFQPDTGATSCLDCVNGVVTADHRGCTPAAGYQPGSDGVPIPCPAGLAKAGPGAFACTACNGTGPNGGQRYQPDGAATACLECPVGGTVDATRQSCVLPPEPPPEPPVCFRADSLLTVRDPTTGAVTPRRIIAALPGDEIMVIDEDGALSWSPITHFCTFEPEQHFAYRRMTTDAGLELTVTPNHFLYLATSGAPAFSSQGNSTATGFAARRVIAAADVQVGDQLFVQLLGASAVTPSAVVSIEKLWAQGAFNVHTLRGNAVVDRVATSNSGTATYLQLAHTEAVKYAANAKIRLAYCVAPRLLRRLHAWGLLTSLNKPVVAAGIQAQIMAQSPSMPLRLIGSVFNFLYNRVPAAFEAVVVAGHGLSYAPSCSHHDGAAAPAAEQSTADYTLLRTGAVAAAAAVPTLQTASAAIRA